MKQNGKTRTRNWNVGIPVLLWILCLFLGVLKAARKDNITGLSKWTDILNSINSNTFSTFISIIVCKLYLYFSTDEKGFKREQVSGLAMKNISWVFIISFIYVVAAVLDSAIDNIVMIIIFLIINLMYLVCFFKIFLAEG